MMAHSYSLSRKLHPMDIMVDGTVGKCFVFRGFLVFVLVTLARCWKNARKSLLQNPGNLQTMWFIAFIE